MADYSSAYSAAIGGGISAGTTMGSMLFGQKSAKQAWKRQKQVLKNQIQWRVQDLRKAGLNPILAAGGALGGGAPSVSAAPSPMFDIVGDAEKGAGTAKKSTEQDSIKQGINESKDRMLSNAKDRLRLDREIDNLSVQNRIFRENEKSAAFGAVRSHWEAVQSANNARVGSANARLAEAQTNAIAELYEEHPWLAKMGTFAKDVMGGGSLVTPFVAGAAAGAGSALGTRKDRMKMADDLEREMQNANKKRRAKTSRKGRR